MVSSLTIVASYRCHISIAGVDGELDDLKTRDTNLNTLQTNQINAARAVGIPTESISGSTTPAERRRIENDLKCGHPYTRLLYVTPELLAGPRFRKVLTTIHQQGQLIRVAIDEAHCIRYGHGSMLHDRKLTRPAVNGATTFVPRTKSSNG